MPARGRSALRARGLILGLFLVSGGLLTASDVGEMGESPTALFPDGHRFRLELARTPSQQARGYMFRSEVGDEEGMLFLFRTDAFHSIWMMNCWVPLDLLWLDQDLRLVHVEPEVPPCRERPCPSYAPLRRARYVLELRAGMAAQTGIKLGDQIQVRGVRFPPAAPQ